MDALLTRSPLTKRKKTSKINAIITPMVNTNKVESNL